METKPEGEEGVDFVSEVGLPEAKLSPTANPLVYQDRRTGELYYLQEPRNPFSLPKLIKLNNTRQRRQ